MAANKQYYDHRLHNMLRFKRPHRSATELAWADRFIMPYKPTVLGPADDPAAYMVVVRHPNGDLSDTLFSSHVDTVHTEGGVQKIRYNEKTQQYYKNDGKPLGADDGAGVWLMLEMIDALVPGTYMFHRGEERGGIGSRWLADNAADLIGRHKRAIAFDRRGSSNVITHQGMGRCCSDEFAEALADALNVSDDLLFQPDDSGIYTDTAEYVGLIGECTNLSVGYDHEHSGRETLLLSFLFQLRDQLLNIAWDALPCAREPGSVDYADDLGYGRFVLSVGARHTTTRRREEPAPFDLYDLTYYEMLELAEEDPEFFVSAVRAELGMDTDTDDSPWDTPDYDDALLAEWKRLKHGMQ